MIDRDEYWRIQTELAKRAADPLLRETSKLLTGLMAEWEDAARERNQLVRWRGDLVEKCRMAGIPPGKHVIDAYLELQHARR